MRRAIVLLVILLVSGTSPGIGLAGLNATLPSNDGGSWRSAGTMAAPRAVHSATLLADGTVLVAGGDGGYDAEMRPIVEESAEIYDPRDDRWRAAASMPTARVDHAAVRLPDGTVLVIGGLGLHQGGLLVEASTDRYDPLADRWEAGPPLEQERWGHTATVLGDGSILVTGGFSFLRGETASVERYDPERNRWDSSEPMHVRRTNHVAVPLGDGGVLMAGGYSGRDADGYAVAEASAERYDPATDTWTVVEAMQAPRTDPAVARLVDGGVLVVGGDADGALATAERFDPVTESWRPAAALPVDATYQTATVLADGTVLVLGYTGPYPAAGATVALRYDPEADTWVALVPPAEARKDFTATLLPDSSVLLVGGNGNNGTVHASAERFAPGDQDG